MVVHERAAMHPYSAILTGKRPEFRVFRWRKLAWNSHTINEDMFLLQRGETNREEKQ
jgi:hypothetical protein